MSDTVPYLERRLSLYEAEMAMLDRSRDDLKEAIIRVRMEIERRRKESAYVKQDH